MKLAEPPEYVDRPKPLLVVATLVAVSNIMLAARMHVAVENFQVMFRELGVLPTRSTDLVFSLRGIWWLFALVAIALLVWIARRSQVTEADKSKMKMALIATVAVTALMYAFTAFAIYPALFKLGATV